MRRASLSDTSCARRTVRPVSAGEVLQLAREVHFPLGGGAAARRPPMDVEDAEAFDALAAGLCAPLSVRG